MQPKPLGPIASTRTPGWWYRDAIGDRLESPPPTGRISGRQRADVVVVGGGFCGLWTAITLKQRRPQARVLLLEADRCGSGASGKNGGIVSGYWGSLRGLEASLGADGALTVARLGSRAQDALRQYCTAAGRDVGWREAGKVAVATDASQLPRIDAALDTARRLAASASVVRLSPAEVQAHCASPAMLMGLYYPEGATVHPGRLVNALVATARALGVEVYEQTPASTLVRRSPAVLALPGAEIIAADVVLATNASLSTEAELARCLTLLSSYAVMTAPAPEALQRQGWHGDVALHDLRMFLHYFRKTPDGRVLMGSGSGPIARTGATRSPGLDQDPASGQRAERGLRRLLPALAGVACEPAWGGVIDVASDRLPWIGTFAGTRVHYACGFSGHGVNPTYIAAQCLSARILNEPDDWSRSPFCMRTPPALPPEPWRTLGGRAIRWGILTCEEAVQDGRPEPRLARGLAALPARLGMRIGTR